MNTKPDCTANKYCCYNKKYNDTEISDLVQQLHEFNCKANGWFFKELKTGCFGYDNLAMTLSFVLDNVDKSSIIDIEQVAELVHEAWIQNYTYWRDNKPWLEGLYSKPAKALGDGRRNMCASTPYSLLPKDEQEKDVLLANWIFEHMLK